jgi:hypothetical protein
LKVLFIVGGAARSGKTLLARRMLSEDRVPWFSLDVLRNGLTIGAPELKLNFDHDDLEEGDRIWPIVAEMTQAISYDNLPYLLEGSCLRPSKVADLMDRWRDRAIKAVFLGYPELTAEEKLSQIAANPSGGNDWFSPLTEAEKRSHVDRMINDSRVVREECELAGIPFFDTSHNFEETQVQALKVLRGNES